jgi:hypothetical protein
VIEEVVVALVFPSFGFLYVAYTQIFPQFGVGGRAGETERKALLPACP